MAGGVAAPLQSTGHRTNPQGQVGHQAVEHAALAHPGGTTEHRQLGVLQPLAQILNPGAGLAGDHQSVVTPSHQSLNQSGALVLLHEISFGQQELDRQSRAFCSQQKPAGLIRIKSRLIDGKRHHHQRDIGHLGTGQPAATRLNPRHHRTSLDGINGLHPHTISDMNRLPPVTEARAAGAEQPRETLLRRLIQFHLQIVGLQRHHDAGRFTHDSSTSTGDLQGHPGHILGGDLHPVTSVLEPRDHHRFRFPPIQLHLKLLTGLE